MTSEKCIICDTANIMLCQQCRSVEYCSKECQKLDWSSHKLVCSQFKEMPARPGEDWRLAIFFPEDNPSPKLIWVELERQYDPEDYPPTWYMAKVDQLLCPATKPESSVERKYVGRNPVRNRNLEYQLEVAMRDRFLFDGSQLNLALVKATKGGMGHNWSGPIIAMRANSDRLGDITGYLDITSRDIRDVVDYFLAYGKV